MPYSKSTLKLYNSNVLNRLKKTYILFDYNLKIKCKNDTVIELSILFQYLKLSIMIITYSNELF